MAKYIVLRFEEDDLTDKPVIVAEYKAPTLYCECATTEGSGIKKRGWRKGVTWGWWVCDICSRPSKLVTSKAFFSDTDFGFNLLDTERRQYDGYDILPIYLRKV